MKTLIEMLMRRPEPAILDARAGDAAALAALHARAFRHGWSVEEFERLLLDPKVVGHLARQARSGDVEGFVLSHLIDDEAEVLMVAVGPAARGRGLGGRLLSRHLARLAARGARRVFLEVDEGNVPARRLYGAAGFAEVGRRPGYYVRPEGNAAALILRRDLV